MEGVFPVRMQTLDQNGLGISREFKEVHKGVRARSVLDRPGGPGPGAILLGKLKTN